MKSKTKFFSLCLAVAASSAGSFSTRGQNATATISDVPVSGGFDYTILLMNTGTTNLNGFWYAWTDSGNNLATTPSDPANSLGWGNAVFNSTSIRWQNSTGTALAPGNTGTFTFFSATTPTDITTAPSGESVAYVQTIGFNENEAGISSPVFSPELVTAPEPSSLALFGVGGLGLFIWTRPQFRTPKF